MLMTHDLIGKHLVIGDYVLYKTNKFSNIIWEILDIGVYGTLRIKFVNSYHTVDGVFGRKCVRTSHERVTMILMRGIDMNTGKKHHNDGEWTDRFGDALCSGDTVVKFWNDRAPQSGTVIREHTKGISSEVLSNNILEVHYNNLLIRVEK